jgi:predicted nucleotidyltransferase component of viral defense system
MVRGKIINTLEKYLSQLLKCDILPPGSYLAGGTAVYLYLKHRISVDLDFFTPENFNLEIFIHGIKKCFDDVDVELMEKNTVILFISKEKIKFSLFFFPYELLSETQSYVLQNDIICPLASLEDIEAMKAVAVNQRGSAKDFIDLYFILKKTGHWFDDILKLVRKKYDLEKEYEYQLRTSFIYFDDAEREVDSIFLVKEDGKYEKIRKNEWEEIKTFFKGFLK